MAEENTSAAAHAAETSQQSSPVEAASDPTAAFQVDVKKDDQTLRHEQASALNNLLDAERLCYRRLRGPPPNEGFPSAA